MTRTLKFYGCSDDLFEIEGTARGRSGEPDEVPVGLDDLAIARIEAPGFAMLVIAQYGCNGQAFSASLWRDWRCAGDPAAKSGVAAGSASGRPHSCLAGLGRPRAAFPQPVRCHWETKCS